MDLELRFFCWRKRKRNRKLIIAITFLLLATFLKVTAFPSERKATSTLNSFLSNSKSQISIDLRGTVVDDEGIALPGVSVLVKQTKNGTVTDGEGKFALKADKGSVLVFSLIGFENQEVTITDASPLKVVLKIAATALNEVSVTALGIKRETKSLGYAVQEVKGEVFKKVKEPNILSNLTGRVAGLTINNRTGTFEEPFFNIRGATGILFVVDGVPTKDTWSINPEDVEKMDIIKGPTGAALYGSDGINGVIMITTKKGGNNPQGLSVEINSSSTFNAGYVAEPEYQTKYGQGLNGLYNPGQTYLHSWGPALNQKDPTSPSGFVEYVQWNSPTDPLTGALVPLPWITRNTNPIKSFLDNGYTLSNSISLGGNNDYGDFRVGIADIYRKGNTPTTDINNRNIDLSGGYKFYNKLKVDAKVSYNNLSSDNYEDTGYNWDNYILNIGNNIGPNVDMNDLKNYWVEGKEGIEQRTWLPGRNNPYWLLNEKTHVYNRDRFTTWIKANYQFSKSFNLMGRLSNVYNAVTGELKENKGNLASTSDKDGSYTNSFSSSTDFNAEWLMRFNKKYFENSFGVDLLAGGNHRAQKARSLSANTPSLIISDLYNLSNKTSTNNASNAQTKKLKNSFYGSANFDYKSKIFLGVTGRNDWSSALVAPYDSYFYPSASLSGIISEMVRLPKLISYAKVRGSWSSGRQDVGANWNDMTYSIGSWNNIPTATYTASLLAPQLRTEKVESFETGVDLRFFGNRLGFDITYFNRSFTDQISVTSISPASGFTGKRENGAGEITKGFEYAINGSILKSKEFEWNSLLNMSYYKTYVSELAPGKTKYLDYYRVGERINRTRGRDFVRSMAGDIIYENGLPLISDDFHFLDTYNDPKLSFGFINSFRYKNWTLSAAIDGRVGGIMYNYMFSNMMISGVAKQSAEGDIRELAYLGKGVKVIGGELIKDERGNIVYDSREYAANDIPVNYYEWVQRTYKSNYDVNAFDASFIKLREIAIGANLPKKWLRNTPVKNASFSLVGRNLFLYTKVLYTDPDRGNDDAGQGPSVRNIGFNFNVNF